MENAGKLMFITFNLLKISFNENILHSLENYDSCFFVCKNSASASKTIFC